MKNIHEWRIPGEYLGVLGGGQLGRMFAQAAQKIGYKVLSIDPDTQSPTGQISDHHLYTELDDPQALAIMAEYARSVTIEFENVPTTSLEWLAANGCETRPKFKNVAIAQDRLLEKSKFKAIHIPCVPNTAIESTEDIEFIHSGFFPAILKTARMGYDGKGQVTVKDVDELRSAFERLNNQPCVLEKKIDLKKELSVIIARNQLGQMVSFPVAENVHRNGILHTSTVNDTLNDPLIEQAIQYTQKLAINLNYHGILCAEYFVSDQDQLFINEFAPRPHNSGHFSMNACNVSQFDLQARICAGLPLIKPKLIHPCVMINILGDIWFNEKASLSDDKSTPNWYAVHALDGVNVHLYGKTEARIGRKMGHINCTAPTLEDAQALAQQVMAILGIAP